MRKLRADDKKLHQVMLIRNPQLTFPRHSSAVPTCPSFLLSQGLPASVQFLPKVLWQYLTPPATALVSSTLHVHPCNHHTWQTVQKTWIKMEYKVTKSWQDVNNTKSVDMVIGWLTSIWKYFLNTWLSKHFYMSQDLILLSANMTHTFFSG